MEFNRVSQYTKLIEEFKNKENKREELFWIYVERGILYFEKNEYDNAISDFNNAILINPVEEVCYFYLGLIYKEMSDYEKAEFYFKKALRINNNNNSTYMELANIYHLKDEYEKAIKFYSKSISKGGKKAEVFYLRSFSYLKLGKLKKAIADLTTAIKLKPSISNYYFERAKLFIETKEYPNAINDLTQAISLEPLISCYKFERGVLYAKVASIKKNMENIFSKNKKSIFYKRACKLTSSFKMDFNYYYKLSLEDINAAIEEEEKIKKSNINPIYYLTRGAIKLSMDDFLGSILDFSIAKMNIKVFPENFSRCGFGGIDYFPAKYYLIKALIFLYLDEYDESKKYLDDVLNSEIDLAELDILYASWWWKAKKNFEKANFWFQRALKKGFDIDNLLNDIFEGYFLKDFLELIDRSCGT